jgi:imidazolonepropionase-like amidohydrolase
MLAFCSWYKCKEFGYMVEAGMPAFEAIQSATTTNAMLIRVWRMKVDR